jgi:long-subunit fatty acid transport protein
MGVLRDKARVVNADPNEGDGKLRIRDTDFAFQGNFGLMVEPSENTRFGLRYLTKTKIDWKDKPRFGGLGPKWQYSAGFSYASNVATEATRSIELPISAQYKYGLGLNYQMRKDLQLGAAAEFLYEGNLPVKQEEFFGVDQVGGKYQNVSISIFSVYGKWTF